MLMLVLTARARARADVNRPQINQMLTNASVTGALILALICTFYSSVSYHVRYILHTRQSIRFHLILRTYALRAHPREVYTYV